MQKAKAESRFDNLRDRFRLLEGDELHDMIQAGYRIVFNPTNRVLRDKNNRIVRPKSGYIQERNSRKPVAFLSDEGGVTCHNKRAIAMEAALQGISL